MIFEITTLSVFFICLAIGSIFAAIITSITNSIQIELVVFVIFSVLSMYFIRPIFKKIIGNDRIVYSNIDAILGCEAVVTVKITPTKIGFVKILNEIWRAKSDIELEVGEVVKIKNIEGTTLIVKK
jgi:membrane protein implicated in regulation of membrane protease activity